MGTDPVARSVADDSRRVKLKNRVGEWARWPSFVPRARDYGAAGRVGERGAIRSLEGARPRAPHVRPCYLGETTPGISRSHAPARGDARPPGSYRFIGLLLSFLWFLRPLGPPRRSPAHAGRRRAVSPIHPLDSAVAL